MLGAVQGTTLRVDFRVECTDLLFISLYQSIYLIYSISDPNKHSIQGTALLLPRWLVVSRAAIYC